MTTARGTWLLLVAVVLVAAVLIVAGTVVPVNGGGNYGYQYAIFNRRFQRDLWLFAAEPLAVAGAALLAALLLARRAPMLTAGILAAFGFQSLALFLAYLVDAAFGPPNYNSFRPGGLLGALGAALLLVGSMLAFRLRRPSAGVGDAPNLA